MGNWIRIKEEGYQNNFTFYFCDSSYTMVLYYYAFCVLFLLLARPIILMKLCEGQGRRCIYAALYFLPITAMIHGACAGLLCKMYLELSLNHIVTFVAKILMIFWFINRLFISISSVNWVCFKYSYIVGKEKNHSKFYQFVYVPISIILYKQG